MGEDIFPYLLEVKRADLLAQSLYKREEKEMELQKLTELYQQILEEKNCISIKSLAVNGSDLIAVGMQPGKAIGETLHRMLDMVLEDPSLNTKEYLLSQISFSE